MNISIGKWLLLGVGVFLVLFGAYFFIQAIPAKDWVMGLFAVVAIAIGSVFLSGKVLTVSP